MPNQARAGLINKFSGALGPTYETAWPALLVQKLTAAGGIMIEATMLFLGITGLIHNTRYGTIIELMVYVLFLLVKGRFLFHLTIGKKDSTVNKTSNVCRRRWRRGL